MENTDIETAKGLLEEEFSAEYDYYLANKINQIDTYNKIISKILPDKRVHKVNELCLRLSDELDAERDRLYEKIRDISERYSQEILAEIREVILPLKKLILARARQIGELAPKLPSKAVSARSQCRKTQELIQSDLYDRVKQILIEDHHLKIKNYLEFIYFLHEHRRKPVYKKILFQILMHARSNPPLLKCIKDYIKQSEIEKRAYGTLKKARRKYEQFYKKAGISEWFIHFLRGNEKTKKYWIKKIEEARKEMRELGSKGEYIRKRVNSVIGDISDIEKKIVRFCYDKSAKEPLKNIVEYIKEDTERISTRKISVVKAGRMNVISLHDIKPLKKEGNIITVKTDREIEKEVESTLPLKTRGKIDIFNMPKGIITDGVVKSTKDSAEITKLISELIGPVGNMICGSKSWFEENYGDRVGPRIVFNANVFTERGEKVFYGDLLLGHITVSLLKKVSILFDTPLYVLHESRGRFLNFIPDKEYLEKQAILKVDRRNAWLCYPKQFSEQKKAWKIVGNRIIDESSKIKIPL